MPVDERVGCRASADGFGGVGLGQGLAQGLFVTALHVVLQQESDAHGLAGVFGTLKARRVNAQLRGRGMAVLDLHQPPPALLFLKDRLAARLSHPDSVDGGFVVTLSVTVPAFHSPNPNQVNRFSRRSPSHAQTTD